MRLVVSSLSAVLVLSSSVAMAQAPGDMQMPAGHVHVMPGPAAPPLGNSHTRDASGTSWLPDASPMLGLMRTAGPWTLMLHGNAFVQFIQAEGERGDDQFGSVNWIMPMAQRAAGGGLLQVRSMFSAEPATVGRCGYPTLVATGEECHGESLHDRQHPHDMFMELAARYRRAISGAAAIELYGGLVGEPALGPTGFPHRLSAMPNPIAPVGHHWLDSTHVSFGVVTGGVYGHRWKAEATAFNGREPDEDRYDLDLGAMDSYSGRLWFMPTSNLALQVSAGRLVEADGHGDDGGEDVDRVTASATYHVMAGERLWATTVAWGRNSHRDEATSAVLAETAVDLTLADVIFARGELVQKTAADLGLPIDSDEPFTVTKLQTGYTRWLGGIGGLRAGVGGSVGLSFLPDDLHPFYGGRTATEAAVYLTVNVGREP